ncbi:MAG: helix-turn-helix transcriptional regulator [Pseudomonadota bacterium]
MTANAAYVVTMHDHDALKDRPPHLFPEAHLKRLRKQLGINQEELAHRLGTYLTKVSRYEGGSPEFKLWMLPIWAEALGVSILECLPPEWLANDPLGSIRTDFQRLPLRDQRHVEQIVAGFAERAISFEHESQQE